MTYVLFQRIRQTNNTTCSGSLARNEDLRLSLYTARALITRRRVRRWKQIEKQTMPTTIIISRLTRSTVKKGRADKELTNQGARQMLGRTRLPSTNISQWRPTLQTTCDLSSHTMPMAYGAAVVQKYDPTYQIYVRGGASKPTRKIRVLIKNMMVIFCYRKK